MVKQFILLASMFLFLSCNTNPFSTESSPSGSTVGDTETENGTTAGLLTGKWEQKSSVRRYFNNQLKLAETDIDSENDLYIEIDSLSFDTYSFNSEDSSVTTTSSEYSLSNSELILDTAPIVFETTPQTTYSVLNGTLSITHTYNFTNAVSVEGVGSSIFKIEDITTYAVFEGKLPKPEWK